MRIQHVNGTWWNENTECFGPEQVATDYDYAPLFIGDLDVGEFADDDIRYYESGNDDAVARGIFK